MRFPCRTRGAYRPLLASLAALVLLGGCRGEREDALAVAVIGTPDALDPRGPRLAPPAQLVQAATSEGLVGLDQQGQVVPALADRSIVTDDGASYIFRLRDGTWPDRTPLTAQSVARALRETLDALRGTPLGVDLAEIGEVRAMTDRVLELRLARPVPELLQLLAQPEVGLRRRDRGSGPFELARPAAGATAVSGQLRLVPIPLARLGLPQGDDGAPPLRAVRLRAMPAAAATEAFARGEVAVVLGGRFNDLPLGQAAAGLSRRALQIDPVQGLFGLAVMNDEGLLASPDLREALAMAIDRDALAGEIALTGWSGSTRIVPAGAPAPAGLALPGTGAGNGAASGPVSAAPPSWSTAPLDQRQAEARARIARWKARSGLAPVLRLGWPAGPGADAVFARLAADFAAVGVSLQRVGESQPADLRLLDLVARYPGAMWYLNQLSCAARRTVCSPALDARLAVARAERDPDRRAALLAAAEAQASAAGLYLPLGSPIRWSLAQPGQPGFAPNGASFHPLAPLARRGD